MSTTITLQLRPMRWGTEGDAVRNGQGEAVECSSHRQNAIVARREEISAPRAIQQLLAEVIAAEPKPREFTGYVELTDVLLDIEVDGVRCIVLKTRPHRSPAPALTARELEIARMVARGLPNKSMATVLDISTWTVSSHLRRMFAKLGVTTRAEMIGRLLEEGCFQPSDLRPQEFE
ncbi:helix-turn-helix domain-containing protein [Mycolicibacterium vaccae]|uniref:helix-turn-helix domain-containing protein n=1 Tax=Mycolicibacterium vaccae TaxID=1810 RepID=UPI003CFD67C9